MAGQQDRLDCTGQTDGAFICIVLKVLCISNVNT